MPTLSHDCPHCGVKNIGFEYKSETHHPSQNGLWHLTFVCNGCGYPLLATIFYGHNPKQIVGNLAREPGVRVMDVYPRPQPIDVPEHLPPAVEKAFKEGCEILKMAPSSAATTFRKALELALKDLSPDIEAWKLHKRIDKMADAGLLTKDLKEWSHQLRLDGNDAAHDGADETQETAIQIRELTKFVLIYLFTLPGQVKKARTPPETSGK